MVWNPKAKTYPGQVFIVRWRNPLVFGEIHSFPAKSYRLLLTPLEKLKLHRYLPATAEHVFAVDYSKSRTVLAIDQEGVRKGRMSEKDVTMSRDVIDFLTIYICVFTVPTDVE